MLFFGRSEMSVRILEVLCVGVSCAGLVKFGELRLESKFAGLVSAIFLPLFFVPFGHWDTAQPESYQMPFLMWALALWPSSSNDPSASRRCVVSGLLMGAAMMVKTPSGLLALALLGERLLADLRLPRAPGRFRLTLRTAAAMAAAPLATAAYYFARGAGEQLFDALFVFSPNYARRYSDFSWAWHSRMLPEKIAWCLPLGAGLLLVVGIVRGCLLRRRDTAWLGLVALISVTQVVMQAKYITYHLLILIPVFAMGIGLAFVPGRPATDETRVRRILRIATVICAVPLTLLALIESSYRVAPRWSDLRLPPERQQTHVWVCWHYHQEAAKTAEVIRQLTRPGDSIFLWANDPLVYFLSDRRMAGPYPCVFLPTAPWQGPRRVDELVRRLAEERPRLIMVGADDPLWSNEDSRLLFHRHPQLKSLLLDRYRLEDRPEKQQFWVLAD
jgi:hypothetical protein